MAVLSRRNTLYSAKDRRFLALNDAEEYLKSLSIEHSRLRNTDSGVLSTSTTELVYSILPEPFISAGPDQYLLCGDDIFLSGEVKGITQDLEFQWQVERGTPGNFSAQFSQETEFFRSPGDSGDKTILFRVFNQNTQIFNFSRLRLFATPTDMAFMSGGIDNRNKLTHERWGADTISLVDRPHYGDPSYKMGSPGFLLNLDSIEDDQYLTKVELLVSAYGEYAIKQQSIFPNIEDFYEVDKSEIVDIIDSPGLIAKMRYTYNFRSQNSHYAESSPIKFMGNEEQISINEFINVFQYNNHKDVAESYSTDTRRLFLTELDVNIDYAEGAGLTGPINTEEYAAFHFYTSPTKREILITVIPPETEDSTTVNLFAGTYQKFETTLLREGSGQIGGG